MTDVIPRNQHRVKFNCPENLLDQFIYDDSKFKIHLKEGEQVDHYLAEIKVIGHLNGFTTDLLWECLSSKRAFIELARKKTGKKKESSKSHKILVLDLDKLASIIQLFDEMGIKHLDDHVEKCPLWSLASIDISQFKGLPLEIIMSKNLKKIQDQMIGIVATDPNRFRKLSKRLCALTNRKGFTGSNVCAICILTGFLPMTWVLVKPCKRSWHSLSIRLNIPKVISIVVCPTSLVYNWKEEFDKFNPNLKVLPVDGTPVRGKSC